MDILISALTTIFWGLVMFSLIVFVHEAGHYTAARLCGMRVREFMIGLPGPSLGFTIGDTRYGITPFLLGGYALIAGMQYEDESESLAATLSLAAQAGALDTAKAQALGRVAQIDIEGDLDQLTDWGTIKRSKQRDGTYRYQMPAVDGLALSEARQLADPEAMIAAERRQTYLGASYPKRVFMLVTGAAFNLAFAIIVFTTAIMAVGDGRLTTIIDSVSPESPAMAAGIIPGDEIVAIDGQPVATWEQFYALIGSYKQGDVVTVTLRRGSATLDVQATLTESGGRAILGVTATVEAVPVGFVDALARSLSFILMVAVAIIGLFNPATFTDVVGQSSSVVGISVEAASAAEAGFLPFIVLAAALSISIGLMNLLPLPPLDGGKIVLETIQRIVGRPIPMRVINSISMAALVLLGLLFITVTWQDIQRYFLDGL
jgi:regulator of sigma E protease